MSSIRPRLDERRQEFLAYARLLKHYEKRLALHAGRKRRVGDLPTNETFQAMRATAFLMLYNIVEATIVGAMAELYKIIKDEGCTLPDVSEKVQNLWIEQRFWIAPDAATPTTYRDRARLLLRETMVGTKLTLDSANLRLGGNLDNGTIRKLCGSHGCDLRIHRGAKGGAALDTVKGQRNVLAHGVKTFVECGREYAVSDIERIARQCFVFLGGFIRSVERFASTHRYRASSVPSGSSPV